MDERVTPAVAERRGALVWAACGASVTGALHEQRGLGCDDAYSYGVAGDFVVAAVADGAGSVSGTSAWGAYAACQSVLEHAMWPSFIRDFHTMSAQYGESQIRWLFDKALERVRSQADSMGVDVSLLSTTLSVALADRRRAVFGQIGDGVIASETDGRIETLLIESKDEYANSTWFIQSDRAFEESFRTATQEGVTAFALSTDGMSYKITDIATGEAYQPFFKGSWQHVRSGASADQLATMLRGIEDDQTGDDKTLVLAAAQWQSNSPVTRQTTASSQAPGVVRTQPGSASEDTVTDPLPVAASGGRRRWWRRRR
jgi:hypothetical protein